MTDSFGTDTTAQSLRRLPVAAARASIGAAATCMNALRDLADQAMQRAMDVHLEAELAALDAAFLDLCIRLASQAPNDESRVRMRHRAEFHTAPAHAARYPTAAVQSAILGASNRIAMRPAPGVGSRTAREAGGLEGNNGAAGRSGLKVDRARDSFAAPSLND